MLLLESSLLVFKAPPSCRLKQPCTPNTLQLIEQVTRLADNTKGIEIVCTPNIWVYQEDVPLSNVTSIPSGTVYEEIEEMPSNTNSFASSNSLVSIKSLPLPPSEKEWYELPELSADQAPFKRSYFGSDGRPFDVCANSRFFVIKSYSLQDVQALMEKGIWASTELGNKRLDRAFRETLGGLYLFFSVNSLAKFCGVARMSDAIDFTRASDIWVESSRWKGIFPVEWLIMKEVPNRLLRHLRVYLNENKPVANSRDTQELPFDIGIAMMGTFDTYVE